MTPSAAHEQPVCGKFSNEELPEGWVRVKLPEVSTINMGQSPPGSSYNEGGEGLPFFQGKADFGQRYPKVRIWCTQPKKVAKPGDVLLSVRAPVGPTNVADRECIIGRGLAALTPLGEIPTEVLLYALRLLEPQLSLSGTGSTFTAINKSDIENIEMALPPIAEQKRIVAKVEELLSRVNAVRERLAKVPTILKRFRQSVLAAACSGRLTADWRVDSEIKSSGTQILDFIAPKRNSCEKSTDINSAWHFSSNPRSWDWAFLSEIAESRLGKMLDKKKNVGVPTKYLRNINVRWFGFDLNGLQEMKATKEDRKKLCLCDGDVLVCEGGEPGRAAVWENNTQGLIYQKALHRIRLKGNIQPKWLAYNLWVDADSKRLDSLFTGTTIKHLTGKSIAKYPIAIPSIEEQKEIVRRVGALFHLADAIKRRVAAAAVQAENMTQAILAKAFRGELVPTEAELALREGSSYEPASTLLAKIEAQRKDVKPQRKRGRSRRQRNK